MQSKVISAKEFLLQSNPSAFEIEEEFFKNRKKEAEPETKDTPETKKTEEEGKKAEEKSTEEKK